MKAASARDTAPALRVVMIALAVIAAGLFAVWTFRYLLVLFAGVLFAVLLHAISDWLARHTRLPYGVVLTAVVVLGLGSTVLAIVLLAPTVGEQFVELQRLVPRALAQLKDHIRRLPFVESSTQAHGAEASGDLSSSLGALATAVGSSIEVVSGIVIIFFLGVYGAASPQSYRRALLAVTPAAYEDRMGRACGEVATSLSRWLLGRIAAMLFVAITSTISFYLLDLPLALALGVFAGLMTFVEYAGAVLSAIPPILLALTQSPTVALIVAALFTGLHVIEGYVLTPLFARAAVRLPPAVTLSAQVLLGSLVGPLGLTFSTPLLVVGVSAAKSWRRDDVSDGEPRAAD